MAFSPNNLKGVLGKFKPVLDKLFTRTVDNIQGVLGRFTFILDETSVLVPDPPTLTTQAATDIEDGGATGNGNIVDTGGQNADKRGFVFGKTSQSDPGNVAPGSSGYDDFAEDSGDFGTGAFTKAITGLAVGTVYYIRAYAKNTTGHGYGNEQSFTTLAINLGNFIIKSLYGFQKTINLPARSFILFDDKRSYTLMPNKT